MPTWKASPWTPIFTQYGSSIDIARIGGPIGAQSCAALGCIQCVAYRELVVWQSARRSTAISIIGPVPTQGAFCSRAWGAYIGSIRDHSSQKNIIHRIFCVGRIRVGIDVQSRCSGAYAIETSHIAGLYIQARYPCDDRAVKRGSLHCCRE